MSQQLWQSLTDDTIEVRKMIIGLRKKVRGDN